MAGLVCISLHIAFDERCENYDVYFGGFDAGGSCWQQLSDSELDKQRSSGGMDSDGLRLVSSYYGFLSALPFQRVDSPFPHKKLKKR